MVAYEKKSKIILYTGEENAMRNRFLTALLISFLIIMFSSSTLLQASSEPADDSFAAEGANAYDTLKENIKQSTNNGYEQILGDTTGQTDYLLGGVDYAKKIWVSLFYILDVLTSIYRFAMVTSISIGILVFLLASKNKKIKKFALYFLIIALPVILTIFRYGIPCLYTDMVG